MNSSSRGGASVVWLAVHTTEGIMRAVDLRAWVAWPGSSHASNDETGVLLTPAEGFVPYDRMAWTLRNANPYSENIEQCGWARWTRAEWLARPKLLDTTARWLADRSKARGIPLRRLTDDEIRRRVPGVLGHGDYSRATGDGTHTDPGPNYPWDVVLAAANAYAAGGTPTLAAPAPLEEDDMLFTVVAIEGSDARWMLTPVGYAPIHSGYSMSQMLAAGSKAVTLSVPDHEELVAAQEATRTSPVIDSKVIADAVAAAVSGALAKTSTAGVDPKALAAAIADEQDRRARDANAATGPLT